MHNLILGWVVHNFLDSIV